MLLLRLRLLKWGNNLESLGWASCNHKGPYKKEADGQKGRRCYTAGCEDRTKECRSNSAPNSNVWGWFLKPPNNSPTPGGHLKIQFNLTLSTWR